MIPLIEKNFTERNKSVTLQPERLARLIDESVNICREKSDLNCFITELSASGREQAAKVMTQLSKGGCPPLAGVVLAVKDNIALEDVELTCASKILSGYRSPFTATALQRLLDAGAVVIGKTNMDEFAMGSSNENSAFGPVLNPYDKTRVPGGSSGGSAAAVAAGMATCALGSETGGSVRQPAAFCGLVGLKPTYGRVSRYGLVAFGSSLDQIGVLARDTTEVAHVFQIMAGVDSNDNTSSPEPIPDCITALGRGVAGLRIGLPDEYFADDLQPAVKAAVNKTIQLLRNGGAYVDRCSLPNTKYAIPTYYIIAPAEASSNLARYDGVRYGYRPDSAADIIRAARQDGFGDEVKRRIMLGTFVLASGYYEAYYLRAQKVRRLIRQDLFNVFDKFDLLMTPTTPTTAFKLGEKSNDPLAMYLSDIFTASANLAGVPAISCPAGYDESGLPIGVQFMAPDFREDVLFSASAYLAGIQ